MQPITGTPYYRLRNEWSGRYLNVRNDQTTVVCYDVVKEWWAQQWELIGPPSGPVPPYYQFINRWIQKYLTVMNTSNYAAVTVQAGTGGAGRDYYWKY